MTRPLQTPLDPLSPPAMADDDEKTCWICLAGAEEVGEEQQQHRAHLDRMSQRPPDPPPPAGALGPLLQVCACPRRVHASCCARWQLHSAGKR